jgi:hypothetical protein
MESELLAKHHATDSVVNDASEPVEIVPVHPDRLDVAWPIVEPWLANALTYGPKLYETRDIYGYIAKKEMILWIAIQSSRIVGMSITSVHQFPQAMVADIHWTGGDKHKSEVWLDRMMNTLKKWAKHCGADVLAGGGRRGWIKKYGFRETGVNFEMELKDV